MVSVNTEKLPPSLIKLFLESTRRYDTLWIKFGWPTMVMPTSRYVWTFSLRCSEELYNKDKHVTSLHSGQVTRRRGIPSLSLGCLPGLMENHCFFQRLRNFVLLVRNPWHPWTRPSCRMGAGSRGSCCTGWGSGGASAIGLPLSIDSPYYVTALRSTDYLCSDRSEDVAYHVPTSTLDHNYSGFRHQWRPVYSEIEIKTIFFSDQQVKFITCPFHSAGWWGLFSTLSIKSSGFWAKVNLLTHVNLWCFQQGVCLQILWADNCNLHRFQRLKLLH